MLELLRWALLCCGTIYFVTESVICAPVRVVLRAKIPSALLDVLLYCPSCSGFWIGLTLFPFWPLQTGPLPWLQSGVAAMCLGRIWAAHVGSTMQAYEADTEQLKRIYAEDLAANANLTNQEEDGAQHGSTKETEDE